MDAFASMQIAKGRWTGVTSACDWKAVEHQGSSTMFILRGDSEFLCGLSFCVLLLMYGLSSFRHSQVQNYSSNCQIFSFSFLSSWSSWASNIGLEGIGLSPKNSRHGDDKNRVVPTCHCSPHFIAIFLFQMPFLPTPGLILQAKAAFNIMFDKYPNLPMVNNYNKLHASYSSLCLCPLSTWMFTITAQNFWECQKS